MKKFKGLGMLVIAMGLMFGLTGCISEPPQDAMATTTEAPATETPTTEAPATEEPATQETTAPAEQAGIKEVIKPSSGEFVPSEEMKKVMTGDVTALGYNGIYAAEDSEQAISDAITAGHYYVMATEDGPKVQLKAKESIMGDSLSLASEQSFKVEVSGLKSGSVVKVISDKGLLEEKKVMGDKYEKRVSVDVEGFWFAEVWSGDGQLVAITNPMFVKP